MLSEPTYLPARMAAPMIEAHFARHRANSADNETRLAAPPKAQWVEAVIDVAFWASLRREEGRPPRISLALLPPEQARQPLVFGQPRRLTPYNLLKLAPAVEQPGLHLGVWHDADGLYVWGTVTRVPPLCFVLEVVEPGLLVAKHRRAGGYGKFVNVAVLRGDHLQLIDEAHGGLSDCPALRAFLPGRSLPSEGSGETDNVLLELAAAMRAHGRGGLVLVVPAGSEQWQASVVHPLTYPVAPAYRSVALRRRPGQSRRRRQAKLQRSIGVVGGFTAVDGATVITQRLPLAGLWGESNAGQHQHARWPHGAHRARGGQRAPAPAPRPARRHPPPGRRPVCARPARRHCPGRVRRRLFHRLRLVREVPAGACPQN